MTIPQSSSHRYPARHLGLPATAPLRYVASMPTDSLVVLCTLPDREQATRLARALVEERLAACASLVPGLTSVYRWQGAIQQDEEVLLLVKTTQAVYTRLEQRIRALHPYELPEIIAVPIQTGQADYLKWIQESLTIAP